MAPKLINHKLFKPILIVALVLILVFIFVLDNESSIEKELSEFTSELYYDEEVMDPTEVMVPAYSFSQIPSTRELKDYYSKRQYPGAPPVIPHSLIKTEGDFNCMNCHESGGYVPRFAAYTPITPHPQFINCQQCHVPEVDKTFDAWGRNGKAEINWVSVVPVKIKRPAIAGGPSPIPHSLQLREDCLSCHAGPAAVKQIRTPHPERVNCVQCHVPQKNVEVWVRK